MEADRLSIRILMKSYKNAQRNPAAMSALFSMFNSDVLYS